MRPSKRIHHKSDNGGCSTERTGGYTNTRANKPVILRHDQFGRCWCGEGMAPNKSLCTECYSRVPDGIQKALYNRGHFIDSHWQVVKRAIEWLKENPKEAA